MTDQTALDFDSEVVDYDHGETVVSDKEIADWKQVHIWLHPNGAINWAMTVFYVARFLTQQGHNMPKAMVGKPYADSWWGPETFNTRQIESYLMKFGIEPNHVAIRKELARRVRESTLERVQKNTFKAASSML